VVRRRILPSIKFKRKSAKLLSLSELTNLKKNSEIEVSKGKVFLCLDDEWTRSVREEPKSFMIVGSKEGTRALIP